MPTCSASARTLTASPSPAPQPPRKHSPSLAPDHSWPREIPKSDSQKSPSRNKSGENQGRFKKYSYLCTANALVAKLVDAPDLGSGVARRVGSSPIRRTHIQQSLTASSDNGSQGLLFFLTHPSKAYGVKQGVRGQAGLMSSVRRSGGRRIVSLACKQSPE